MSASRPDPLPTHRWAIAPAVVAGFGVTMLLLLAAGFVALREQSETFRAGDRSRSILLTLVEIARLRDAVADAESGQRGYILTGNEAYLDPYERGSAEMAEDVSRLREQTKDDPRQQERLARLEPLLATKLGELRESIALRRGGDEAGALALVRTHVGRKATEDIRALLGELESQESRRLDEVLAGRETHRSRVLTWIATVTSGALLAMLASMILLARTDRGRRRAEEKVRDTEERLRIALARRLADTETRARAVLDTTASAIISIDAEGRVETFNQAAERLFGYALDEIVGQNVKVLMPAPYRAEHDGYLRRYLETGERRIIGIGREVTGLRKDGTTFPMALAVGDVVVDGRHVFTGVVHDLTREKEAEERERRLLKQALQNERLADIGAMTARIAHDFGNPLAGLRMTAQRMLQLLTRDPHPVDGLERSARTIVTTVDRLQGLVGEFKDFAREQRLQLRDIALPAFLHDVVAAWQHEASRRGIALEIDVGDPPPIRGDYEKLRRVMDNLVKNALEAIDRGPGTIRLAVEAERHRVRIRVEDTGPGVPHGRDVFVMFETTKATGTGLGLSICRQIVLAHGGDIEHARRSPTGTVFQVELPTDAASPRS